MVGVVCGVCGVCGGSTSHHILGGVGSQVPFMDGGAVVLVWSVGVVFFCFFIVIQSMAEPLRVPGFRFSDAVVCMYGMCMV